MPRAETGQDVGLTAWIPIGLIGAIDLGWAWWGRITFINAGLYVTGVLVLIAVAALCRAGRLAGLGRVAQAMAQFLAFLLVSQSLSFLCATPGAPLRDAELAAVDRALGFDWPVWAAWVWAHPIAHLVLLGAYVSYIPHFTGAIVYYTMIDRSGRASELLSLLVIALALTMLVFALFPAKGPWVQYGIQTKLGELSVRYFSALRSGALHVIDLRHPEGIVAFPSFHAVYAVLLTYIHSGRKWLLGGAVVLNGAMLLSLPEPGGHYLVDILLGLAIAATAIAVLALLRRSRPQPLALEPERLGAPASASDAA